MKFSDPMWYEVRRRFSTETPVLSTYQLQVTNEPQYDLIESEKNKLKRDVKDILIGHFLEKVSIQINLIF